MRPNIGNWNELENCENDREKEIQKKTLELFRSDSRNIEIITYDELFERAKFIVGENEKEKTEAQFSQVFDNPIETQHKEG